MNFLERKNVIRNSDRYVSSILITESYVIWNLLSKVELLETWVEDFSDRVRNLGRNQKIDSTGHFEG